MPIIMHDEPAPATPASAGSGAGEGASESAHDRLTLRSQLADLSLVSAWVQALGARHGFSARLSFAVDLCLEEALSNVIRHGYAGDPTQKLDIAFDIGPATGPGGSTGPDGVVTFVIEDAAPYFRPFDPEIPPAEPSVTPLEEIVPGGQGIPLMRKFADSVEWQPLEKGNRLTLRFSRV